MNKFIYVIAIVATGLLSSQASATKISTTVSDVKKQCGNAIGCSVSCGSTSCDYSCTKQKGKTSCEVVINRVSSSGGGGHGGTATTGLAH